MNILDALDHPQLFKKWFDAPTWEAWRAFLAALFALPMSEQQLGIYRHCTKRTAAPSRCGHQSAPRKFTRSCRSCSENPML